MDIDFISDNSKLNKHANYVFTFSLVKTLGEIQSFKGSNIYSQQGHGPGLLALNEQAPFKQPSGCLKAFKLK